jgi:PLP dependent protein
VRVLADPALVAAISERGDALRRRIAEHTDRPVRIVCVTKGHPVEVAAAALSAGFEDLGENYAQELQGKAAVLGDGAAVLGDGAAVLGDGAAVLGDGPRWHFIGRLQTNKVRLIAGVVELWHTIDRAGLAEQVARRAPGARVLVQLDLAGIEGRGGCEASSAPDLVQRCQDLGLVVEGLMGVGPPGDPEASRPGFRLLDRLAGELGLPERSMGMSGDLEVAVQEGATIVRVGSALVGPRPPR